MTRAYRSPLCPLLLSLLLPLAGPLGCSNTDKPLVDGGTDAPPTDGPGPEAALGDGGAGCFMLPNRVEASLTVGPGCVEVGQSALRNGATLTVAPGTTVLFRAGGHLDVGTLGNAALVAVGSEAAPIRFTSISASPAAGDWQCVYLGSGAVDSDIQHATFEFGGALCTVTGSSDNLASVIVAGGIRGIKNSAVTDSRSHGIKITNKAGVRAFQDNRFARNGQNGEASLWVAQNELITLGVPNTFEDADDFVRVDSTFSAETSGMWRPQAVPLRAPALRISGTAQITIAAGTKIQMTGGTVEVFNANLVVDGTAEAPVVFTSANAAPMPGDWGCIYYSSVMGTPALKHTVIEYGGSGMGCSGANYKVALVTPESTQLEGVVIRNMSGAGIRSARDCTMLSPWCAATMFDATVMPHFQCGNASLMMYSCP